MIKVLTIIVWIVIGLGMNAGLELYSIISPAHKVSEERIYPPEEKRKIVPPAPTPKNLNQKLIYKLEIIDSWDEAFEEHISNILAKNKYKCGGKDTSEYVSEIVSAILKYCDGNLDLALWITSMMYVESSFRLNANPKVSTARGLLQVIYRYHKGLLGKFGIAQQDLYSDPAKSVYAGILVFKKYLRIEHGNYAAATRRYRGLSVSKKQQEAYLNGILRKKKELQNIIDQYA